MTQVAQIPVSPWLDENRRLVWIAPLAVVLWLGLLLVFARLLSQTAAPPPQINAVEARIVELPAPAGLQSSPAAAHAPVAPKPEPRVAHRTTPPAHPHRAPTHPIAPPVPASAEGTAKSAAPPSAPTSASNTGAAADQGAASNLAGSGNDNSGARALYAPAPEIPDDLREDALVAVAIAHFEVGYDGQVRVTLTQPTMNPRLNELLLETLRQWRFAPAARNGIAIESQFDIRIPVTIQ